MYYLSTKVIFLCSGSSSLVVTFLVQNRWPLHRSLYIHKSYYVTVTSFLNFLAAIFICQQCKVPYSFRVFKQNCILVQTMHKKKRGCSSKSASIDAEQFINKYFCTSRWILSTVECVILESWFMGPPPDLAIE